MYTCVNTSTPSSLPIITKVACCSLFPFWWGIYLFILLEFCCYYKWGIYLFLLEEN